MPDSDITVSGLATDPGIGYVLLRYAVADPHENGGLPYLSLEVVEIYASTTNDFATATKVTEGNKTNAFHGALTEGTTWYYWAIARNKGGSLGDRHPAGATAGVQATVQFSAAGYATASQQGLINGKITATAPVNGGGHDLVIALKTLAGADPSPADPLLIAIKNSDGSFSSFEVEAAVSVTISDDSEVGQISTTGVRVWLIACNDAGTLRLAAGTCAVTGASNDKRIRSLSEHGEIDVSAEGGAGGADDIGFYAAVAMTGVRFRVLGFLEWSYDNSPGPGSDWTVPDKIELYSSGNPLPGDVVQRVELLLLAGSVNANIPLDNTIPLYAEGAEIIQVSDYGDPIVPTSDINLMAISVDAMLACSVGSQHGILALFWRSGVTGTCAAAAASYFPAADVLVPFRLTERHTAGLAMDAGEIDYELRGGRSGGSGTLSLNTAGAIGSLFGGFANNTVWSIEEIMI